MLNRKALSGCVLTLLPIVSAFVLQLLADVVPGPNSFVGAAVFILMAGVILSFVGFVLSVTSLFEIHRNREMKGIYFAIIGTIMSLCHIGFVCWVFFHPPAING